MRMLDLFCGTKSMANAFEKIGFDVSTLDFDLQFNPSIWKNILDWDYREFNTPDVIWASPPCEGFSVAAISKNWIQKDGCLFPISQKAVHSINLVQQTLKIIKHFSPKYWFVENPVGALRKQPLMKDLPRQTITYCQYGDTRMKPTDIWGTFPKGFPIRKCNPRDPCHEPAPRGAKTGTQGLKNAIERGRVPEKFCSLLAEFIRKELINEKAHI